MRTGQSSSSAVTEEVTNSFEKLSMSNSTNTSSSLAQATVKIRAALDYIDAVKARFMEDESEVYDEFLTFMKAFKSHHIDIAGVTQRINYLFRDHPDLIKGFDNFLPLDTSAPDLAPIAAGSHGDDNHDNGSDSSGTASPGDTGSRSTTPTPEIITKETKSEGFSGEPTIAYIQRVKQQCDAETWEQFMRILSRQVEDPSTFNEEEMIRDVEELFEDHPELIPGFRTLLTEKQGKTASGETNKSEEIK